jgi:transposase
MTGSYEGPPRAERVEVITSVQRRRRWSTEEKVRIVEETYLPGNSVSLVARRHGIAGNQLFTWRRLMAQGALTATGAGEEVVPASEYRAAQQKIRELQRLSRTRSCARRSSASPPPKSCPLARPRGRGAAGERGG